jgi:hypothetical protein
MMIPLAASALDRVEAFQFRSRIAPSKIAWSFFSNSLYKVLTRQGQIFVGSSRFSSIYLAYRHIIVIAVNKLCG